MKQELPGKQSAERSRYFLPLLFAALWNLFIGVFGLLSPEYATSIFVLEMTPLTELATSKLLWCVVLAAAVGYGIVAFAHDKIRFVISIGAVLNVMFFIFVTGLWLASMGTTIFFLAATVDLILGIYFAWFLYQTREFGYF